jgi:undecaprenyl-diphosphatase
VTALIVVRAVLRYVERHGYAVFGWWRIIVGSLAVAGLLLAG